MASDLHNTSEASLTALVTGIINDAQELLKQEIALARREIADEINKSKQAAVSLGVGVAVGALGGWLLILMIVSLLNEVAGLPLWVSYLIVGGVLTIVGCGLFFAGKAKASDINLVPKQTVQTMKENVQWIKDQT
jgi:hypothetical protein